MLQIRNYAILGSARQTAGQPTCMSRPAISRPGRMSGTGCMGRLSSNVVCGTVLTLL